MENDILDSIDDLGYVESVSEDDLEEMTKEGPPGPTFTKLVSWLASEIGAFCSFEEKVHSLEDVTVEVFQLEMSSFLRESGCPHPSLLDSSNENRLHSRQNKLFLIDYLATELQASRMLAVNKPATLTPIQIGVNPKAPKESEMAMSLKTIVIALGFPKPPSNITAMQLFQKMDAKIKEIIKVVGKDALGEALLKGGLTPPQWENLHSVNELLSEDYKIRRETLIKRLDVTVDSFRWSDRAKKNSEKIAAIFGPKRQSLSSDSTVAIADLLAARRDLAIQEKTSSSNVRENTKSTLNQLLIGAMPDRGGRAWELDPPPPEMPSWQKNRSQGGDRGGGRGGRGGGGGGRGGRGGGDGGGRGGGGRGGGRGGGQNNYQAPGGGGGGGGWNQGASMQVQYQGGGGYQQQQQFQPGGDFQQFGAQAGAGGGYDPNRGQGGGGGAYGGGGGGGGGYAGGGGGRGRGGRGRGRGRGGGY